MWNVLSCPAQWLRVIFQSPDQVLPLPWGSVTSLLVPRNYNSASHLCLIALFPAKFSIKGRAAPYHCEHSKNAIECLIPSRCLLRKKNKEGPHMDTHWLFCWPNFTFSVLGASFYFSCSRWILYVTRHFSHSFKVFNTHLLPNCAFLRWL